MTLWSVVAFVLATLTNIRPEQGQKAQALEQVLSVPSIISVPLLRFDPV